MKRNILIIMMSMILPAAVSAQGKDVDYTDGTAKLTGYFVKAKKNSSAKTPGVVVIHQWMGLTQHERNSANKLAELGYNAFAADIYGSGMAPKDTKEASEKAGYYKNNYLAYQLRIKAAIAELIRQGADPAQIAVIGYCFGGTGAIEAARAGMPVKGIVSFHGGLGKAETRGNSPIKTKMLILHGADDPLVPEAEVKRFQQEMRETKADWQMVYFGNAVHAFTQVNEGTDNSKGVAYNEAAARHSWEDMRNFLTEIFSQ